MQNYGKWKAAVATEKLGGGEGGAFYTELRRRLGPELARFGYADNGEFRSGSAELECPEPIGSECDAAQYQQTNKQKCMD